MTREWASEVDREIHYTMTRAILSQENGGFQWRELVADIPTDPRYNPT